MTNVDHELAEFSIKKSLSTINFDEIVIFSDRKLNVDREYKHYDIPVPFERIRYSTFCLKELYHYINTDHFIIIQPDGMAVNPQYWNDEYLKYDYIGAPFNLAESYTNYYLQEDFDNPVFKNKYGLIVGNGGFTLRSKKLLEALQDDNIPELIYNKRKDVYVSCEDVQTCLFYRPYLEEKYNIKFAPAELAMNFSSETIRNDGISFGFHGIQNLPLFFNEEECLYYIDKMEIKSYNFTTYKKLNALLYEKDYIKSYKLLNEKIKKWKENEN